MGGALSALFIFARNTSLQLPTLAGESFPIAASQAVYHADCDALFTTIHDHPPMNATPPKPAAPVRLLLRPTDCEIGVISRYSGLFPVPTAIFMHLSPDLRILLRPARSSPSTKNQESIDREYQAEQERLRSLQRKHAEIDENRGRALFGEGDEKEALRSEVRNVMEQQLREKEERRRREREIDQANAQSISTHVARSSTAEASQEQQRREYLRQLMEENQRLVEARRAAKDQERQRDMQYERQEGASFFERWGHNAR
ncbi:hypothetical protein PAPYR_1139 [Paratrimastix pyriformis]|uniref:Uncharacterized protein n=1 Tax=Paratrimastix pyriformis TaxID=342808 RepID=A0ABQ8UTN6_9EUKA|nr:hypothetical protein PAPYR_1139 [Paratrimastix pyriformis]